MRILFTSLLLFSSSTAISTTFAPREFPEAVKDAPIIVRGEVLSSHGAWGKGADQGRRIYTYVELQNAESLKGKIDGRTIIVRELGGKRDGLSLEIPGTAKFKIGEEVVLLLSPKNTDGSYDVRGLMMGKYDITKNQEGEEVLSGGEISVQRDQGFAHEHGENREEEGQSGSSTGGPSSKKWTVSILKELIRTQSSKENIEESSAVPSNPPTPVAAASPGKSDRVDQASPLPENEGAKVPQEGESHWVVIGLVALGLFGLAALIFGVLR